MTGTFNLADLFEQTADAVPDRPALVAGADRLTYRDLDERATRFADWLRSEGVAPGDHVAVIGWNSTEWYVAMLGVFKARAAVVNVNYRYTRTEVVDLLRDAEAVLVVADGDLLDALGPLDDEVGTLRRTVRIGSGEVGDTTFAEAEAAGSPVRRGDDRSGDDRYLLYTGGTTGRPKGVMWRSEDLFFSALGGGADPERPPITEPEQLTERLVPGWAPWLVTSPLMHGNGQWNSLRPLLMGAGAVLWTERRFDAAAVARLAAAEGAQLLVLIGDGMAVPFVEALDADPTIDLSCLAAIGSGGAVLSPRCKTALAERLPNCRIVDGFGASETGGGGAMIGTGDGLPRFLMTPDMAVLDDELRPLGVGEVGLLGRRGRIPLGYWNDPAKTAETFPTDAEGVRWSVPGDHARREADGTITLLGRGSTSINTGGEKVHPDEVANAVKTHPAIADAIVVGVPDERWGQAVAAVVSLVDGATAPSVDEVRDHVAVGLARFKAPRHLVVVDEIAYTAQAKPDVTWARTVATAPG